MFVAYPLVNVNKKLWKNQRVNPFVNTESVPMSITFPKEWRYLSRRI
jgi:hypothetical protein